MASIQVFLVLVTLFTGSALYIHVAEHPARMRLDDLGALAHWKVSYGRAKFLQGGLALAAFAAGLLLALPMAGDLSRMRVAYLAAALLMLANWPWTLLAMRDVNAALLATAPEEAGADTRRLLVRWNALHAVRTASGFVAIALILLAPFFALMDVAG